MIDIRFSITTSPRPPPPTHTRTWSFRCFHIQYDVQHDNVTRLVLLTLYNHDRKYRKPLTLYGHIKTAEQRTIIQQYGDWYTGR